VRGLIIVRPALRCVICFTLGLAGAVYAGDVTERSVMAVGRSLTAAPLGRFLPRLGPVGFCRRGLFHREWFAIAGGWSLQKKTRRPKPARPGMWW